MTELTNDKQFRFVPQIGTVVESILPLLSPKDRELMLREIEPALVHRDWQVEDAITRALACCGSSGGTDLTSINTSDTFSVAVANAGGQLTDALLGGSPKTWVASTAQSWPTNLTAGLLATPVTIAGVKTLTVPTTVTDHGAQFSFAAALSNGRAVGVVCRYSDDSNFYMFQLFRTSFGVQDLYITKVVAGVTTNIAGPLSHAVVIGDVLKFTVIGTTLTGYLNGVVALTVTDTGLAAGTKAGVYALSDNAGKVDDFITYT